MRIFSLAEGDATVIDGVVSVTVLEAGDEEVLLAIEAPDWLDVGDKQSFAGAEDLPPASPC